MNDLRFAARQLIKSPGFTTVAVLTLALGIGANTAIFTAINTLLLRSLPVKDPDELVQISTAGASGQLGYAFSYPAFERLRDGERSLSGLFTASGVGVKDRLIIPDHASPETEFVRAQAVSGNFFSVLDVSGLLGRILTASDDETGKAQALAVISYDFWQRRFGANPSVIGKEITFNDVPFTIVGVAPAGFFGFQPGENPELWWPLQMAPQVDGDPSRQRLNEGQQVLRLMGRLSAGVTLRQAEAELSVIYERYREAYALARKSAWTPEQRRSYSAEKLELKPGHAGWTNLRAEFHDSLLILMAVVAAVLLIACANVASLLLARAAAREREFSVRSALGAGRLRLVRQLLTESVVLAALGGILGLVFAQGATRVLQGVMRLPSDPVSLSLEPDARVLLFTGAASLLTGLLFGLAPAFRSSRLDLASALKGTAGGVAGGALGQRPLQWLVVVQVALALVLLISAGLFVRTLRNLRGLDAGFTSENVVLFNVDFTRQLETKRWTALYKELLVRLEAMPGVRAASLFSNGYLSGNSWTDRVSVQGVADPDENIECAITRVGSRFFETFGTPLLSGREFGVQDERPVNSDNFIAPGTTVINQALARLYFGDANPLGKRVFLTHRSEQKFEIVGVVPDAKYRTLREPSPPMLYLPYFQEVRGSWANFAVRTAADPRPIMADLLSVVRTVDQTVRVRDLRTMNEAVNGSVHQERLIAQLGGFFSLFALALACLGLYGLLSFDVVQRTREIGLRMALGAQRRDVLSLVVGKGVKLALIGSVIGLAGALAATRLVSSLLYGVTATDPVTFVGVSLVLLLVALLASWLPACRATKVDPMEALRWE